VALGVATGAACGILLGLLLARLLLRLRHEHCLSIGMPSSPVPESSSPPYSSSAPLPHLRRRRARRRPNADTKQRGKEEDLSKYKATIPAAAPPTAVTLAEAHPRRRPRRRRRRHRPPSHTSELTGGLSLLPPVWPGSAASPVPSHRALTLDSLPEEVLVRVLRNLSSHDLAILAQVGLSLVCTNTIHMVVVMAG